MNALAAHWRCFGLTAHRRLFCGEARWWGFCRDAHSPSFRREGHSRFFWLAAVVLAIGALGGCAREPTSSGGGATATASSENASGAAQLRILAGSELKDVASDMEAASREAGVRIEISYSGTLDMVDRINAGERFDAILPPNGAYPSLALAKKPLAKEKLFYSRVTLGLKQSKARALGWDKKAPSWADIAKAAKEGRLAYGMTNPTSSNTGMSALFAVASSIAKKTEDLTADDVNREALKGFLAGQKVTAGSSGWLADSYLQEQDRLDGLVNYEAVILRLNERPELREPLVLIYPQDGVISADYPLMLLEESKRELYMKVVAALKSDAFQTNALSKAYLRPANPGATRSPKLPNDAVAELSFPNRLEVIDAVLLAYQADLRRPSTSIYLLDVSGSMEGERIAQLRKALEVLTGAESNSVTARFIRFQNREKVVLIKFSSEIGNPEEITFADASTQAETYAHLRDYAARLEARGGTAIYSSLDRAYQIAMAERRRDPDRFVSVVLLTDGQNRSGLEFGEFRRELLSMRQAGESVRTFPIVFGEASSSELSEVAELTGGRAFEGRDTNLAAVFKEIRGYQ
jgi:Ca-activated chloride channel family protein